MVRTVCHPGFPQCNDVAMSGETQTRGPKDTDTANNQYNCRLLVFSCLLAQYKWDVAPFLPIFRFPIKTFCLGPIIVAQFQSETNIKSFLQNWDKEWAKTQKLFYNLFELIHEVSSEPQTKLSSALKTSNQAHSLKNVQQTLIKCYITAEIDGPKRLSMSSGKLKLDEVAQGGINQILVIKNSPTLL